MWDGKKWASRKSLFVNGIVFIFRAHTFVNVVSLPLALFTKIRFLCCVTQILENIKDTVA